MAVAGTFTATSTAYTRPQIGTAEPRFLGNVTVTGWSSITNQQTGTADINLTGGYANGTPFLKDYNVVELRWDPQDANAWEAGLVLLPAMLVLSGGNPRLRVSILNASGGNVTPADHQFVLAIW